MYLLDTCFLSELIKPQPNQGVIEWIGSCDDRTLFVSIFTLGEIQKGISKVADLKRQHTLQRWLDYDLLKRFDGRFLEIDAAVAMAWGKMQGMAERDGRKLPVIDSLIAATAIVHHLKVVTRNVSDIEKCGVAVVNPWSVI